MTVGELREFLSKYNDSLDVVVEIYSSGNNILIKLDENDFTIKEIDMNILSNIPPINNEDKKTNGSCLLIDMSYN